MYTAALIIAGILYRFPYFVLQKEFCTKKGVIVTI